MDVDAIEFPVEVGHTPIWLPDCIIQNGKDMNDQVLSEDR
jgi:hypothetical protein